MKPRKVFLLSLVLTLLVTLSTTANASLLTDPGAPGAAADRPGLSRRVDASDIGPSATKPTDSRLTGNRTDAPLSATVVIQVTPSSGMPGEQVRIQGAGFTPESVVTFGGTSLPPSSVTYVAPTQLRALVPEVDGLVAVRVRTGNETTAAQTFSVLAPMKGKTLFDVTADSLPVRLALTNSGLFVDADGDADLDLFVSENTPPPDTPIKRMRLLVNDGAGVFTDGTDARMPATMGTPGRAQAGDIDGDGDQDILANNALEGYPGSLLINDGTGHFTDEWSSRVSRVGCHWGVLGDVDNDGDLDLLLACWPTDRQLLLNDGTGHFTPGGAFPVLPQDEAIFVLGDVDSDGDLDALGAWYTSSVNWRADLLYINDGHGNFADESSARLPESTTYNGTQSLLADLDGDSDLDGFIMGYAYDPEYVLLNDGTGHFTRSGAEIPSIFACFGCGSWVEPGDIDSDGDTDLVLATPVGLGATESILLLNQGNGQFEPPSQSLYPSLQGACKDQGGNEICESAALGDVNNDGALDLFLARAWGSDTVQQSLLYRYLLTITACKQNTEGAPVKDWLMTLAGPEPKAGKTMEDGCVSWAVTQPGAYTVTEEDRAGWTHLGATSADFAVVSDGGPYSHTFVNFKDVTITACKQSVGATPIKGWSMTLAGPDPKSGQTMEDGCIGWTVTKPGAYTVTEENRAGWLPRGSTSVGFAVVSGGGPYSHIFVNSRPLYLPLIMRQRAAG